MLNLSKGSSLNLEKNDGSALTEVAIWVDWGMIETKGFWWATSKESVDLDLSVTLLWNDKSEIDTVYFGNKSSSWIKHSWDDLSWDEESDGSDNEVITMNLSNIKSWTKYIVVHLVSYGWSAELDKLPYATARVYSTKNNVNQEKLAEYKLTELSDFKWKKGIIMWVFTKNANAVWTFKALGTPISINHPKRVSEWLANGSISI